MEIRTFTSFWTLERKLYTIYDITLPVPISLKVLGVFVGAGAPWWLLMWLLHVPFSPPIGYLLWLAVPGVLAWAGSRPIFEGKTLYQAVKSRARYLLENKRYKNSLRPDTEDYVNPVELQTVVMTRKTPRALPF